MNRATRRKLPRGRNRTRMLFYVIIALILAVIAWSLSIQLIDPAVLLQIYIAATILSVGVIVIDMLGLLGEQHGDEGSGYDLSDHSAGHDGGEGGFWGEDAADADDDFGSMDGEEATMHSPTHSSTHSDQDEAISFGDGPILEAIRYLRMFVYFCLGFGLIGLAILLSDGTPISSLLFAGLAGAGTVILARIFYRFQPQDTGEELSDEDLLLELATVLVPLSDKTMGNVRVSMGMEVRDVYALAATIDEQFKRGDRVRIVRMENGTALVDRS